MQPPTRRWRRLLTAGSSEDLILIHNSDGRESLQAMVHSRNVALFAIGTAVGAWEKFDLVGA